jgi:hypothetical protein
MTRPVYRLDTGIPSHGEKPVGNANPQHGLEQLIDLAERQAQYRHNGRPAETPEPPPTPVSAPDAIGGTKAAAQKQPRPGWAGPVLVVVALGVLGQAWIGYHARIAGSFSSNLWYLTLCLIFTPSAALIMSRRLSDRARVWLTLYMSLALLATRYMLYPTQFVYHDELINYRVLLSIEKSGHLFTPNSLLPASADYPGMEIAAAAIHQLTGLSLHSAGIVVLLAVRIVMTLALIRITQRISKKVTVGCLAALIYATNPQYIFFNSTFAYQSVALPLCFFCVYIFAIQRTPRRFVTVVPAAAVVVAVAATHHLTSAAFVVVLWVWYLFTLITRRPVSQLLPFAVISTAVIAARVWLARSVIVPYISEIAHNSIINIINFANGKSNHRFFTDPAGAHTPAWQVVLSIASVLIIVSTLMPALWLAIIKHRLLSAAVMVLFTIAAIYPMIPVGHLTGATSEVADRSSGFVFVGLGYLVATWWFRDVPFHRHARPGRFAVARHTWLLILGLTICFVGGTIIGSGPDWLHGPGPYLVSADNRSVDQLALQAASWEGQDLSPGSRVYTDRVNGLLAAVYGNQHVLTSLADRVDTRSLSTLLLRQPMPADVNVACQANVEYLIADKRLAWSLPHVRGYIDGGEYPSRTRTKPPPSSALTKFDGIPGAERIFDNGAIRIYDLRGLRCAGRR